MNTRRFLEWGGLAAGVVLIAFGAAALYMRVDSVTICGTDLHILKGDVPEVVPGTILGHEAVGTVVEVGTSVSTLHEGDRVLASCITSCGRCAACREGRYGLCTGGGGWILGHLIDGVQAEYARIPFADTSAYRIPASLTDEQVLFLADIIPTAYEVGVVAGQLRPGDTVAIVGAGPIGLAAVLSAELYTPRMSLAFYGQWVISGVVEEKNNRVVELILSAVRPQHLLAGKVIGIGLLGFAQLALVAGLAAALFVAGAFDAPAALGGDIALVLPWFVLGFALYAVSYAVAGALASSQQNAETAGQPITYTLIAVFFAGYVALSADPGGAIAGLLTVFPLSAPLVLPARSALVGVPPWQHALALVLTLASIYALVGLAGRVYAHGLLHGGARMSALGWGAVAASSVVLGALLALWRHWPERWVGAVLAFGAGALISAVSFELALQGFAEGDDGFLASGIAAGALTYFLLDRLISRKNTASPGGEGRRAQTDADAGPALALGAFLDGIPEQLVLGLGIAAGEGVSVGLLVAIFISNLPEGLGSASDM